MTQQILEAVFSLLFIIALIFTLAFVYKKFFLQKFANASIKLDSVVSIGVKEKIILLTCKNQSFLIGITPQNISLLHKFHTNETHEVS